MTDQDLTTTTDLAAAAAAAMNDDDDDRHHHLLELENHASMENEEDMMILDPLLFLGLDALLHTDASISNSINANNSSSSSSSNSNNNIPSFIQHLNSDNVSWSTSSNAAMNELEDESDGTVKGSLLDHMAVASNHHNSNSIHKDSTHHHNHHHTNIGESSTKSKSLTQNLHPDGLPWQQPRAKDADQIIDKEKEQGCNKNHEDPSSSTKISNESLVTEFANLAKKLNIELTSSVLESLRQNQEQSESPISQEGDDARFDHQAIINKTKESSTVRKRIKLELSTDNNFKDEETSSTAPIAFVPKVQVMRDVAQETITAMTSQASNQHTRIDDDKPSTVLSSSVPSMSEGIESVVYKPQLYNHPANSLSQKSLMTNDDSILTSAVRPSKKRKRVLNAVELNEKLASLQSENEMLRKQVDIVTNKTAQFDKERAEAEHKMRRMINDSKVSSEELNEVVMNHLEMYADYGSSRHEELTFHLDQLEKLAAPTSVTKMSLWTLGQNDAFFRNYKKRDSLSGILVRELDITPQQGKQIMVHRKTIQRLGMNIQASLSLLRKLKELCLHKQQVFRDRMEKCQEILTPLQVVKLLLWVDNNQDTLNHVCPGWISERIVAPNSKHNTVNSDIR